MTDEELVEAVLEFLKPVMGGERVIAEYPEEIRQMYYDAEYHDRRPSTDRAFIAEAIAMVRRNCPGPHLVDAYPEDEEYNWDVDEDGGIWWSPNNE